MRRFERSGLETVWLGRFRRKFHEPCDWRLSTPKRSVRRCRASQGIARIAPRELREDAAQVAQLASWLAEQKGQPENAAARNRVIDFLRTETHSRAKSRPYLVPLDDALAKSDHSRTAFEERALRYAYLELGWSQCKIAKLLNRSNWWVVQRFKFYGIAARPAHRPQSKVCFCGRPSFKRKHGTSYRGFHCRMHYLRSNAATHQRIRERKRSETTHSRSIAA